MSAEQRIWGSIPETRAGDGDGASFPERRAEISGQIPFPEHTSRRRGKRKAASE